MAKICGFCFPFFEFGSSHPCDHRSGHRGWYSHDQGGPGDEVNRVDRPAGDITCLACLAHFLVFRFRLFFCQFGFHLASFFRIRPAHFILSTRSFALGFFVLFICSHFTTGCATSRRADAQMLRVLKAEDALLLNLKEDRRSQELAKKIHRDPTISAAEERLRDSVDALIKANAELRSAIKNR